MKKLPCILALAALLTACGTTKKVTTKKEVPVPEGLTFEKVEYTNNSLLASINMPISGAKFNSEKSDTPEGRSIYRFGKAQLLIYSPLNKDFKGTLDEQLAKIHNDKYFGPRTAAIKFNEKHIVNFTDSTVSNYDVVKVDISRKLVQGWGSFNYGYIVQHNNMALFIWIKDVYVTPDDNIDEFRKTLDDAFTYMIETAEFKE